MVVKFITIPLLKLKNTSIKALKFNVYLFIMTGEVRQFPAGLSGHL